MTTAEHDVDTDAVEVGTDLEPVAAVAPPAGLFGTDDPAEVIQRASVAATALADVINQRKLFTTIQGKHHVHVEGWTLMGAMLGVTAICVATEVVDGGYKATVEARTLDGRVVGRADALCTKHEKRGPWKTADDYARLSMAQTRATSKALKGPLGFVVSLAGYATTPAEEMTFAAPDAAEPAAPEPAAPASQDKPLTAAGRKKIATALAGTGLTEEDQALLLISAGFDDLDQVKTVSDALTVRAAMTKAGL